MKALVVLLAFSLTQVLWASTIQTKIIRILEPSKYNSSFLLLVDSGDVFELDASETEKINKAFTALKLQQIVELDLTNLSVNKLLGLREVVQNLSLQSTKRSESFAIELDETEVPTPLDGYSPTQIETYKTAQALFRSQRSNTRWRSQCYNRAHVWSYELSKKGINSGKMWLFFTDRYIREYRYKWWFHVSPYVEVMEEKEEIIMDREFLRNPSPLTAWKDIFIKNRAHCPKVEYYSDYRDNHWGGKEYCYLIKSSMYYWQPFNIEALEEGKPQKTKWDNGELRKAFSNAIRWWDGDL